MVCSKVLYDIDISYMWGKDSKEKDLRYVKSQA